MNNLYRRPALGQTASIGTLYNARNDNFSAVSLLNSNLPPDGVITTAVTGKTVHASYSDSYEEKFKQMDIQAALAGSLLAGFVRPFGSGRYLDQKRDGAKILHGAIYYKITTVEEKLNFMSSGLRDHLASTTLRSSEATHVVIGVEWGSQSILTANQQIHDYRSEPVNESQFRATIENFKSAVESSNFSNFGDVNTDTSLELMAFGDMLENEGIILYNFQEAYRFLDLMSLNIRDENGGKGNPTAYSLLPVEMLTVFFSVQIDIDKAFTSPRADCLGSFVQVFDEFRHSQAQLEEHQLYALNHKQYIPPSHIQTIMERSQQLKTAQATLVVQFGRDLEDVRGRISEPEVLWQLLQGYTVGHLNPLKIADVGPAYRKKVELIDLMLAKGAAYIGYNDFDLTAERSKRGNVETYVLWFSHRAIQDEHSWSANKAIFLDLLNEHPQISFAVIVDCDAIGIHLDRSRISHFQGDQEVSKDLLEHRRFLAEKCFARYNQKYLETNDIKKPLKRRFVKIACPNDACKSEKECDWLCSQCTAPIEYGYTDKYIYCDCGRSPYHNYDFKCNSETHGLQYSGFDDATLLASLNSLEQSDYLNILILGETGVGKSTFINAFVNYLTFETLDEAIQTEELNWVIPCSFSTHIMDRSKPDNSIDEIKIQVGFRDDEHDGTKGASATQRTTVYPVTIGTRTIRLIDTPGIGDTRGVEYDRKNIADILQTLSSYDELHGVLILLKSNAARLTVSFAYCITELLTHLHHSAARNMVFGFTNSRITNYAPGDTFGPLKELLARHPDVGISLSTHTAYCFDSESFRYLAALKKGTIMPNKDDFRRSWTHSRDEAWRLLGHFVSHPPHMVKSTLSLNRTRQLITGLTKPMAEISQVIRTNIALSEDQMKDLEDTRLSGDKLRNRLHLRKVQLRSKSLDKPRTVCANSSCTDVRNDGNEENKVVTVYKSHCHSVCHLTDVQADTLACPQLIRCSAFGHSKFCLMCKHHWQEHLHVLYELIEYTATVKDDEIENQLKKHADDVTLRQTAIKQLKELIREYEEEQDKIQEAAAQFCIFLKKHSLTPYNDATLEYLDFLIKEERAKIQAAEAKGFWAGANLKKLEALEEDRRKHEELIKVLTSHLDSNDKNWQPLTEEGAEKLVKKLYGLKHFGENLRSVKQAIAAAHEATYREIPFRVRGPRTRGGHCFPPLMSRQPGQPSQPHEPRKVIHQKPQIASDPPSSVNNKLFGFFKGRN